MNIDRSRLSVFDALRGLAALGVMLFHYLPYYHRLYGHSFEPSQLLSFGQYGVHLFFILSGFVIFMSLQRTASLTWFGMARACRLLPALWIAITLTFITVQLYGPADRAVSLSTALLNFTLMQSYMGHAHVDGAYWSLVVEFTFYFWIAFFFRLCKRWETLRWILYSWIILSYVAVIQHEHLAPIPFFLTHELFFASYAPLFISGILLYRWHQSKHLTADEVLFLALSICHAMVAYPAPYHAFVLGCYGLIILALSGRIEFVVNRVTIWLGSISYPLYLIHQNIGYAIINQNYAMGLDPLFGIIMAVMTALTLAWLIHSFVEKPMLRWFREMRPKWDELPATNRLSQVRK